MATKIDIINSIPPTQVNISRKEFIRLINLVTPDSEDIPYADINKPKYLKKGDVYIAAVGNKRRPVVIAKILDDIVLGIPLSTTKDELNLYKSSSRFFKDGWFSKQLISASEQYAYDNWVGIYDNHKRLNIAVKKLKKLYTNFL